jgi:hypothetical protein
MKTITITCHIVEMCLVIDVKHLKVMVIVNVFVMFDIEKSYSKVV